MNYSILDRGLTIYLSYLCASLNGVQRCYNANSPGTMLTVKFLSDGISRSVHDSVNCLPPLMYDLPYVRKLSTWCRIWAYVYGGSFP